MKFKSLFLIGLIIFMSTILFAQQDTSKLNRKRVFIVGSSLSAALGASYCYIQKSWWSDKHDTFHFDEGAEMVSVSNKHLTLPTKAKE